MKPVVLVEDNGPIHVSKLALAALEARKHWLTVEWLPKYAPELNDIEGRAALSRGPAQFNAFRLACASAARR